MKTLYLAGGCFWGTQKFLDQFDAVKETEVGYANGTMLLRYYFMTIDPTSVNRQGNDIGTQYRTGIWFEVGDTPDENRETLTKIRTVLDEVAAKVGQPLAVEFGPLDNFWPAEEYHQKYLDKHPNGYCHIPRTLMHLES